MTVIAWDGKSLCADKRATSSGLVFTVTKIFRTDLGLVGVDGTYDVGLRLLKWLESGADPKEYPDCQKDNDRYTYMLLITPKGEIMRYEREPVPYRVEEPFHASGGGRDFALCAMHLGKTSREAVEIACRFDNGCGNGVDELFL